MKGYWLLALIVVLAFIGLKAYQRISATMDTGSALPTPPPAPLTKPVKLFSLSYGEGANNIGVDIPEVEEEGALVLGPSKFLIAHDGTIWFADKVNDGRIKQFSRTGQLLRQIKTNLPSITYFAVGTDGSVYVDYDDPSGFMVFDAQGKPQPEIAQRLTKAVRSIDPHILLSHLRIDKSNNLYGQTFLKQKQVTIRVTLSGEAKILPAGAIDWQGRIWGLKRLEEREALMKVYEEDGQLIISHEVPAFVIRQYTVYDAMGQAIRQFNLPSDELSELEKSLTVLDDKIDGRGHVYLLAQSLTVQWKIVINTLQVLHWFVVLEYDGQGNRIGVRAVLVQPDFHMVSVNELWDVDQDGNVYYLDFKSDRVDVMMAPAP